MDSQIQQLQDDIMQSQIHHAQDHHINKYENILRNCLNLSQDTDIVPEILNTALQKSLADTGNNKELFLPKLQKFFFREKSLKGRIAMIHLLSWFFNKKDMELILSVKLPFQERNILEVFLFMDIEDTEDGFPSLNMLSKIFGKEFMGQALYKLSLDRALQEDVISSALSNTEATTLFKHAIRPLEDLRYFFTNEQWNNVLYNSIDDIFDYAIGNFWYQAELDDNGEATATISEEAFEIVGTRITNLISIIIVALTSKFDYDDEKKRYIFKPTVREETIDLINILRNYDNIITPENTGWKENHKWHTLLIKLEIKKLCTLSKVYDRAAYHPRLFYKSKYLLHSYYAKDILDEIQISE